MDNMVIFHRKWIWMCLILLGIIQSCAISQFKESMVFITKTGKKYHTIDCHYLKYSSIKIEINKAKDQGYTPCSVCKPGNGVKSTGTTGTQPTPPSTVKSTPTQKPAATTARQCSAMTKSTGLRCKRMTTDPSGKCWQHQ